MKKKKSQKFFWFFCLSCSCCRTFSTMKEHPLMPKLSESPSPLSVWQLCECHIMPETRVENSTFTTETDVEENSRKLKTPITDTYKMLAFEDRKKKQSIFQNFSSKCSFTFPLCLFAIRQQGVKSFLTTYQNSQKWNRYWTAARETETDPKVPAEPANCCKGKKSVSAADTHSHVSLQLVQIYAHTDSEVYRLPHFTHSDA